MGGSRKGTEWACNFCREHLWISVMWSSDYCPEWADLLTCSILLPLMEMWFRLAVVVYAPLCEVGNCVVICNDGVVVIEESQDCSAIQIFVVCCHGWRADAVICVKCVKEETEGTTLGSSSVGDDGFWCCRSYPHSLWSVAQEAVNQVDDVGGVLSCCSFLIIWCRWKVLNAELRSIKRTVTKLPGVSKSWSRKWRRCTTASSVPCLALYANWYLSICGETVGRMVRRISFS